MSNSNSTIRNGISFSRRAGDPRTGLSLADRACAGMDLPADVPEGAVTRLVTLLQYVRPEVLAYAVTMETELRDNDHKGGWDRCTAGSLAKRVEEEAGELAAAVRKSTETGTFGEFAHSTIGSEAADVGNMAMMVADVCGQLNETERWRAALAALGVPK